MELLGGTYLRTREDESGSFIRGSRWERWTRWKVAAFFLSMNFRGIFADVGDAGRSDRQQGKFGNSKESGEIGEEDRGVISELGELTRENGIQVQLYEMDVALILLSLLRIAGMLERVVASGNAYSGPPTDRGND